MNHNWLLPSGIEEDLPAQACVIESMRRKVLDLFSCWGFDLVIPPLVEYVEALLVMKGEGLDLQTMKLIDQLNGRMMGIRADMTPQVARIVASRMPHNRIHRICYLGHVLKARPEGSFGSRQPLQFGAEIYGCPGNRADREIMRMLLAALNCCGARDITLSIGHVGIYRSLVKLAGFSDRQAHSLFTLLQMKAPHEIASFLAAEGVSLEKQSWFTTLACSHGDDKALAAARKYFSKRGVEEVLAAINEVEKIAKELTEVAEVKIHFDLAELTGYHYRTGISFAAYVPGVGQEVARGGRYDNITENFGAMLAATGFSSDLHLLSTLVERGRQERETIFAPLSDDPELRALVTSLRASGKRVVEQLRENGSDAGCHKKLVKESGSWEIRGA